MTQSRFPATTVVDDHLRVEGWWEYTSTDPWAVVLQLGRVRWIFARKLLLTGLSEPAGDGDVQVMPDTGGSPIMLNVRLSSPSGVATVAVARDTVMSLLDSS